MWGRPVCTALYAIPAHYGGRTAARLTSLGVAIAMALLCRSIAGRQGWRWPALAVVFTFAQPLVFLHSFAELTELPFAFLMTVAFLAYQRRRWFWLAVVVGLTPLSRPEGFGFLVLAAAALVAHGRARWLAVLAVPLVAWDVTGWWLYGGWSGGHGHWWRWLADNWPYAGDSLYDRGYLLKFVAMMPAVAGPIVFPATVVGVWLCLGGERRTQNDGRGAKTFSFSALRSGFRVPRSDHRRRYEMLIAAVLALAGHSVLTWTGKMAIHLRSAFRVLPTDHRRRCDVLIAVLPLMVLAGHSVLTWTGKMASNGEVRYMLVVAPFWALLAARGWGWAFDTLRWPRVYLLAGLAAVAPVCVNRMYTVLPQHPMPSWVEAAQVADWYRTDPVARQYHHVALAHPGLLYALDFKPSDKRVVDWQRRTIAAVPPGTLLVWDRIDGLYNADASRSVSLDDVRRAGWVPMPPPSFLRPVPGKVGAGEGEWAFFRSPDGPAAR